MKCRWVVENFTDSEDYKNLVDAIQNAGHDCYVIGRRNNFDFNPSGYQENDCVMFQGSIQMTRHCKKVLPKGCRPIAFCTEPNFLCSTYYPRVQEFLFNDKHKIVLVSELKAHMFDFYKEFGKEAMIYIRPDRGDKPFVGQLLDMQDFERFWNNNVVCTAEDQDLVVVSTPKTIQGEWRYVCSHHKEIIAQSTYQYQGKRTYIPFAPPKATELVNKVLDTGYFPDPVFTIDICQDADGTFWLLEYNSFSSAGLYACDKKSIAEKVSSIAEHEWESSTYSQK
jgi:hypothetical protein